MSFARFAPLSIVATLGVAFASACGDEKSVADAAAATITVTPHLPVYQWRQATGSAISVRLQPSQQGGEGR